MRAEEKYTCEICGTEYNNRSLYMACEAGHKQPAEIVKAKYVSRLISDQGYPLEVWIRMSDGEIKSYRG